MIKEYKAYSTVTFYFNVPYAVIWSHWLDLKQFSLNQLSSRVSAVLRHHHSAQLAASPRGLQDGCPSGRRTAEDGSSTSAEQRQIPGNSDRLPADSCLWKPGEQTYHPGQSRSCGARADNAKLRLREAVVDHIQGP